MKRVMTASDYSRLFSMEMWYALIVIVKNMKRMVSYECINKHTSSLKKTITDVKDLLLARKYFLLFKCLFMRLLIYCKQVVPTL